MALQSTDLFVVQAQSDKKLYKLSLNDLQAAIEGGSGINFRGSANLLDPRSGQLNPDPAVNGDLYIVEQDAATINGDWSMADGVTSASANDRVIYDGNDAKWVLITSGTSTGGTLTEVIGTVPIQVDSLSDPTKPIVSVDEATTTDSGVVKRLATAADVVDTNLNPPVDAVVTADLLNATNVEIKNIIASPGGLQTIAEGGLDIVAGGLEVNNNAGAVTIGVANGVFAPYDFNSLTDINA